MSKRKQTADPDNVRLTAYIQGIKAKSLRTKPRKVPDTVQLIRESKCTIIPIFLSRRVYDAELDPASCRFCVKVQSIHRVAREKNMTGSELVRTCHSLQPPNPHVRFSNVSDKATPCHFLTRAAPSTCDLSTCR